MALGFLLHKKFLNANQEYKKINIWGGVEKTLGLGRFRRYFYNTSKN